MKKILIIGGRGFLGTQIAKSLIDEGHSVTIYDREIPSDKNPLFKYIAGDILDREKLDSEIKNNEIIYHLAGISDIEESDNKPYDTIHNNIIGSTNVIECCSKHSKKLMFASTVYVYSKLGSFYRVTKQSIEIILEAYSEKFDLDYTILRYGSLYGPNAQDWNGVKKYISDLIKHGKITIPGTGKERREYMFHQMVFTIK